MHEASTDGAAQNHPGRPRLNDPTRYVVLSRGRGYNHLGTIDGGTRTACGRKLRPAETTAVPLLLTNAEVTCRMCMRTTPWRDVTQ